VALLDDLAYNSATALAGLIRARQVSPSEVIDATIDRIEERDPSLNAVVFKGYDEARERARVATDAVMSGAALGPLHGVPTLMKDLFDFKPGWRSTFGGVTALADTVIDASCVFVERMERDGAIVVGKTNSPVMGFRGTCDNPLFGPTRNPFDTTLNAGGSSGGSAAAVADGFVAIAEGTDAGGSIRIPAAWCGLYGLKPSWGRVPVVIRPNGFAGTDPFVAEGPITRTVADAAIALQSLAGVDARDPYSVAGVPDLVGALGGDLRGVRIAYSPDFGVYPVDPRIATVVAAAARAFEAAGAIVDEIAIPIPFDQRELSDLWCRLITPLNVETFEGFKTGGLDLLRDHRDSFPQEYLRWIDAGYAATVIDRRRDQRMRTDVCDAIAGVFATYDFIVTPTVGAIQVPNATDGNTMGPREVAGVAVDPLIGWCLTYLLNFSGHPAASIPAGLIDGRLPVGLQLVGRPGDDAGVLRASSAFERIQPWDDSYRLCRARPLE
jgi:amidase/aspartyl-tRNA(Asn)/glutamyl-tRNA(Gln) amidotransferase subunit A